MADGTQIRITAVDQTTAAFRSVQANISALQGNLRSIAGPLAAAFSIAGIGAFAKSLIDAADRLNDVSQQSGVAVETLSALSNAAKLNGTTAETLTGGLTKLNKAIGEARGGAKEQIAAFEALGIKQFELANLKTEEVFYRISDAFADAKDGAGKTTVAMTLLGRSGAELIPLLNQGSDALKKFQGTFTKEQAESFARFNDNLDKAGINLQKLGASTLGPVIEGFNKLVERVELFNKLQEKAGKGELKGYKNSIDAITSSLREQEKIYSEDKASEYWKSTLGQVKKEISNIKAMDFVTFNEAVAQKIFELDYKAATKDIMDFVDFNEAAAERIRDLDYKAVSAGTALENYSDAVRSVDKSLQSAAVNGLRSMEDALIGVFMQTMSVKDAFRNMAVSIIQDLIRIQIQRSITGPLSDALSGLFASSNGPVQLAGPRALGGSVQMGDAYMVGEKGPELFIPGKTGTVVPNNQLGGSGAVVNQTINISAGVSQTVRAEIIGLMPQIMESTKAAVLDAKRRGGAFGKAFA